MTIPFPFEQRAKQLVKERALAFGYCPITVAQLTRTFRPTDQVPLCIQASRHVRRPEQSAMVA